MSPERLLPLELLLKPQERIVYDAVWSTYPRIVDPSRDGLTWTAFGRVGLRRLRAFGLGDLVLDVSVVAFAFVRLSAVFNVRVRSKTALQQQRQL